MNAIRGLIPAALLLMHPATYARAQEANTKAGASPSQNVSRSQRPQAEAPTGAFLVKPYLQPGHSVAAGKVVLMWHAPDSDSVWTVETRGAADRPWQAAAKTPSYVRVAVPAIEPHRVYHLALTGLAPGKKFGYRISRDHKRCQTPIS
jgi:hypothetical protein